MTAVQECHICGGLAELVSDPVDIHIGQRVVRVPAERMRCSKCGGEFYLPGQMKAAQRTAADQLREADGLLSPGEILRIRETLGLSQAQFERLLRVGPKTVVRWERGTVSQNSATDTLLRLIRDIPDVAPGLARQRGMELPAHPVPLAQEESATSGARYAVDVGPTEDPQVIPIESRLAKTRQIQRVRPGSDDMTQPLEHLGQ